MTRKSVKKIGTKNRSTKKSVKKTSARKNTPKRSSKETVRNRQSFTKKAATQESDTQWIDDFLSQHSPKVSSPYNFSSLKVGIKGNRNNFARPAWGAIAVFVLVLGIIISGFWGPQIARSLGIPIDPARFTAVYFQNPEIVARGIASGDLVVFGITNGDRITHVISWRMQSGNSILQEGSVQIPANSNKLVAKLTTGARVGKNIEIFAGDLKDPITVSVVG